MDNQESKYLYYAVWAKSDVILAQMQPLEIMDFLVTRRAINLQDRKTIDTEGRVKGDARYNKLLLTYLLKKDEVRDVIAKHLLAEPIICLLRFR